jgi:UDP-N-acetylmuramate dehydrogenase
MLDRAALRALFRGTLLFDEPLAHHTSFAVGGPAEALAVPREAEDLPALLAYCRREGIPCRVIGRGTNLLVSDRPIPGVVMKMAGTLRHCDLRDNELRAGAGVPLPALARLAVARSLSGLEFAGGIPGTVGGAVTMNAGAGGQDMAPLVRWVRLLRPGGAEERLPSERIRFAYREVSFDGAPGLVVEAALELAPGERGELRHALDEWQHRRKATQPLAIPNAGSTFRTPPGDYAARLIQSVGAKGWREGGAEISTLHANFLVNAGGTSADNLLRLMKRAWRAVRDETGIELKPEVHFLGFGPEDELLPASQVVTDFGEPAPAGNSSGS